MKARIFVITSVLAVLALLVSGAAMAQGPRPPEPPALSEVLPPWEPEFDKPIFRPAGPEVGIQSVGAASIPLGQPGLSFRYVQTFGVTETPYISTTTHLNYPYGVGAQGNSIWIGELIGRRALKYDSERNVQAVIGRAGVVDHPNFVIQSVFDVAADSSGNIWVVDGQAHHVLQFDASGNFVKELGKAWEEGSSNDRFGSPNSIAFDSQGNIYISDGSDWWNADWGNQRIQIFDGSGNYTATLGTTGTPGQGNYQFYGPAHIAIYDDVLYVADRGNHRVQIYQIQHSPSFTLTHVATLGQTGAAGDDNQHFNHPSGVAVDANYIYVTDTFNHRVQVFHRSTRSYVTTIGSYGSANGQFDQPYDVAVDASGYLYVADFRNTRVQQFRPAGAGTWNWWYTYGVTGVPYVTDDQHYFHPRGIAVAANGSIYIAEDYGRRIVKLQADGTPLWSAPSIPGVIGYAPNDIGIGEDGNIYVTEGWDSRIRIYTSDGMLMSTFGGPGTDNYHFDDPRGIGVAPNGDIYVADCWNHRVQIYDLNWAYKATMGVNGQSGNDNDHFNCPSDVVIDSAGTIYVADEGNDRVQVFDSNRQYVRTIGGGGTGNDFGHFDGWGPHRLAVDAQNRLYVADTGNNRIQVFDSSGAYLTTIGGSWGSRTGQLRGPFGVAIGPDGSVYVADTDNHRIQKFAPGVPGWKQVNINGFGEQDNRINTLAPFGGNLYAGTYNFSGNGAQLWRTADGLNWTAVFTNGFGNSANVGIDHLLEFNSQLYAGTWADEVNGGEVWRSGNGLNWTRVVSQGFGDPTNGEVFHFAVFSDTLYAGTWSYTTTHGAEIWRSNTGNAGSWTQVVANGFGDANNIAVLTMEEFNGALYVGTRSNIGPGRNGADIWRTTDGITWTAVITNGFNYTGTYDISSLEAFGGYLYAGTGRYDLASHSYPGGQIWRCPAASGCDEAGDWEPVTSDGFGNADNINIEALLVFDNRLYAVAYNFQTGMEVWRTADGTTWEQVGFAGFGDSNNAGTYWDNSTTVFNNRLYIGTTNSANGGEVWQKTLTADFTASPTVGTPGTAVTFTNLSGGDVITATWDFGDGSAPLVSNAATVTHTYTTPGVYTVTLTVQDGVDTDARTRSAYIRIAHFIHLPLVMRNYNPLMPLMALYDDFNTPSFDGFYNPVKWQFWGDSDYFDMHQENGVMRLTSANAPAEQDTVLVASAPLERTLQQVQRFQARLKISPDTNGTGAKIQIIAEDIGTPGRYWWTACDLTRYGSDAYFDCNISSSSGNEFHVGGPAQTDRWYTARIEIDPNTAEVCFYQDDSLLDCHVPDDADLLKVANNFTAKIGAWNGEANPTGTLYFDDVYLTPGR